MPEVLAVALRAERTDEPFIATASPRLSWQVSTDRPEWVQADADLEVELGGQRVVHHHRGRTSVFVAWPFAPLPPGGVARLRVRVTGTDGGSSDWSQPLILRTPVAEFGTRERWISADPDDDAESVHQLRTTFSATDDIARAVLTVTAHGVYDVEVNGERVGDEHLAPGWTAYRDRLLVASHEVTDLIRAGHNTIGVWVAPGWFGERYGFFGRTQRGYAGPPAAIARLTVWRGDGTELTIATDGDWQGRTRGHGITEASIYHGESVDLRALSTAWAGDAAAGWRSCTTLAGDPRVLEHTATEPVRTIETRTLSWHRTPAGRLVGDAGENVVGVARLRASGPTGHTVSLRFTEILDTEGEPDYRPLRTARATDRVTLSGAADDWAPRFTFHGFRYVEIIDWPGGSDPGDAVSVEVWQTATATTGDFTCSDPLVTQLWRNTMRSLRGNLVSVPTDCPQRDERLGWTGDLQVFAPSATGMLRVDALFSSWLADLTAEQRRADGAVPVIVPAVLTGHDDPVAGWGDVATVLPWVLWERYGDQRVLGEQYPSMTAWVDLLADRLAPTGLWSGGMQIGDHLAPPRSGTFPGSPPVDTVLVASVYAARSARLTARAAEILGRDDDAVRYRDLAARVGQAIRDEFVTATGRVVSDAMTAYALLLALDLADPATRPAMGTHLARLIRDVDFRIGTGFLGTPLLMDALVETGQLDVAARLLTQTQCPSWLYPVTMGATTIWERWDLISPDGSIPDADASSFNHYALGAICDWLQRRLAGLAPAAPAYAVLEVRPCFLPGFTEAATSLQTPYGRAEVRWTRSGEVVNLRVSVPPNATARILLPDTPVRDVGSGSHEFSVIVAPVAASSPAPVSLETTLDQLVVDADARRLVVDALLAHDPHRAPAFTGAGAWRVGIPLRAALMFVEPGALAQIESGFAALNAARGSADQDG